MNKKKSLVTYILADKSWFTPSNLLTLLRILVTPVIVWAIVMGYLTLAFWLFMAGAVSDLLDGYLARWLHEQTHLGAMLDPIADKIFLLGSFSALAVTAAPFLPLPGWFLLLLLVRELVMIVGATLLVVRGKAAVIQPIWWGKVATAGQMALIGWMFVCYFMDWAPYQTYDCVLYTLSFFSGLSLLQYVRRALADLFA